MILNRRRMYPYALGVACLCVLVFLFSSSSAEVSGGDSQAKEWNDRLAGGRGVLTLFTLFVVTVLAGTMELIAALCLGLMLEINALNRAWNASRVPASLFAAGGLCGLALVCGGAFADSKQQTIKAMMAAATFCPTFAVLHWPISKAREVVQAAAPDTAARRW